MNHPEVAHIERTGLARYTYMTPAPPNDRRTCERVGCIEKAAISIRGTLHCEECAEHEEGVKVL